MTSAEPTSAGRVVWHAGSVSRAARERLLGQRGCVAWLTGLSGAGKSTIARALEADLVRRGRAVYVLDGDNVRHGLNADLGFDPADRVENIRRIAHVAGLFADAGLIAITAFISPYRAGREQARAIAGPERFIEVYLDVPVQVCEQRDPKRLYRQARAGQVDGFTGVSAPYEPPAAPDVRLNTAELDAAACAARVLDCLEQRGFLRPPAAEDAASA